MEGTKLYVPTSGPKVGSSSKSIQSTQSIDDFSHLTTKPSISNLRIILNDLASVLRSEKSKKSERPIIIQQLQQSIERKPLKPILSRSSIMARIEAEPYMWPHDNSFDPKTTALVIIDMQEDFCSPAGYLAYQGYDITPVHAIITKIQSLLTAFRSKGFPIYHTREGHRPDLSTLSSRELSRSKNNSTGKEIGDRGPMGRFLIRGEPGHDIIPELEPLPTENVIDKPGRSAFQHTEFGLMLKVKGIKNLVLVGATTDVCVGSTMRDANDNGFDCLLVEDATAAAGEELHRMTLESVKMEGGIFGAVSTTERILGVLGGEKGEGGKEKGYEVQFAPTGGKISLDTGIYGGRD